MNTDKLAHILDKVKAGVANKDIIEAMQYFLFTGKNVVSYNGEVSVQYPLETDFSCFVKAHNLLKILAKYPGKNIELALSDNKLKIKGKKIRASLATIQDNEVTSRIKILKKDIKKAKWKELSDNFSDMINLCSFCTSKRETDGVFTCVYVTKKMCAASDNKRIAYAKLSSSIEDDFLLKATEIKVMTNIEPKEYALSDGWVHFRNSENCIFSIRRVFGEYPNISQFMKTEGTKVELKKDILAGLEISEIFVDAIDPVVKVTLNNSHIILSSGSDAGTIKYRGEVEYTKAKKSFLINPFFLKEMLNFSTTVIVGEKVISLETEDFKIVTALCDEE